MINITESEFYNNKVDRNGRAIHTTEGSMNLCWSGFGNNTALHNGGAIYVDKVLST